MHNLLMLTDSYKVSHYKQYPPGTKHVYSYWESRGGRFPEATMFGLSYILQKYLANPITPADIEYADTRFSKHFGNPNLFNRAGWVHILMKHGGRLPVRIKAVPEGLSVPVHNVMLTIENTDPEVPWLTNYLETLLSQLWYPTTVASHSRECKRIIANALRTSGDIAGLPFKLHDFGFRGVSSVESAGIGGAAHLINFMGTDTMEALEIAYHYYGEEMAGFSIPAAEHSTITGWGGPEMEVKAFRNMIKQYGTGAPGMYAVVSDSYDIYNAVDNLWGNELKTEVLEAPNMLIVRPDSGDPEEVVLKVVTKLGNHFGYETNAKGFKVLNKVRVIQGDGVNEDSIAGVLWGLLSNGWSADNIAFGMGGALLQNLNRDTMRFAFKCSSINVDGTEYDVKKSPVTDPTKASKGGRLRLLADENSKYKTVRYNDWVAGDDILQTVFEDGEILVTPTFKEIRERAAI